MKKSSVIALLLVFAMVAATVCATFAFAEAETSDDTHTFWLTHYDDGYVEGAGVVFTDTDTAGGWWLHAAFKPVSGTANVYEIVELTDGISDGKAVKVTKPEGGFVYGINIGNDYTEGGTKEGTNYTSKNCNDAVVYAQTWKVGDKFEITGLDLANKTVPTSTPDKKWYDPDYVCTATIKPYVPAAPGEDEDEGKTVEETITVDGKLDDTGWVKANWKTVNASTGKVQGELIGEDFQYEYAVRADADNVYVAVKVNTAAHNADNSLKPTVEVSDPSYGTQFDSYRTSGSAFRIYLEIDPATGKFDRLIDVVAADGKPVCYLAKAETTAYTAALATTDAESVYEIQLKKADLGIGDTFKMALSYSDACFGETGDQYDVLNDHIYTDNADAPWAVDTHYTAYSVSELALGTYDKYIFDLLGLIPQTQTDAFISRVNKDGSVTITLLKDADQGANAIVLIENLGTKLDLSKAGVYYVGDYSSTAEAPEFRLHYGRVKGGEPGTGDLYSTNEEVVASGEKNSWFAWDFGKYVSEKGYNVEGGNELKDLAITGGKTGDTITIRTLAFTEVPSAMQVGTPLVPHTDVKVDPYNIALGKSYTGAEPSSNAAAYAAKLTDGLAADELSYDENWFTFYYNADAEPGTITAPNGVGTMIIDLETLSTIQNVRVNAYVGPATSGIQVPKSVKAEYSVDGKTYTQIGDAITPVADESDQVKWLEFKSGSPVLARYVKVIFELNGIFAFFNEVEVIGVPFVEEAVVVDGDLNDTGYVEANWVTDTYLQNSNAADKTPADLDGQFTLRMDDKKLYYAVEIKNTIAPNITETYAQAIADKGGVLTASGAQTDSYNQTGATSFRFWLRTDNEKRYLVDVQYLGEELGWVATRAIFLADSGKTWDDLDVEVAAKYDYQTRTLTAEVALDKATWGIGDKVGAFVSFGENYDGANQYLHLASKDAKVNDSGYIMDYSGDTNTEPYVWFENVDLGTFSYANYAAVEKAIADVSALNEANYTAESWAKVQEAIAAVVYNKHDDEQSAVDAMAKAITDAVAALQYKGANYDAVNEAKAKAALLVESNYTAESWKVLQDALAAVVDGKDITEQAEVDAMAQAILDAIDALEEAPIGDADYTAVNELKKVAAALNESDYTAESWKVLQDALAAVVEGKKANEQAEVDAMAKAISDAIVGLVKVTPSTPVDPSDSSTTAPSDGSTTAPSDGSTTAPSDSSTTAPSEGSSSSGTSSSPQTGDSGIVIFAVLAVLSLAGAIVAVRVRH